jgi:hypothetical protein
MVAFTVMDHDVLTANDFAGEAFLALGTIPGVADYSTSIDNFHGLKQIDLPLMQQKVKSEYIHSFLLSTYEILLSTYEIWKVLVSLAKKKFFFIADFHVLGLFIPKKRV